jgi:hypothetical protein
MAVAVAEKKTSAVTATAANTETTATTWTPTARAAPEGEVVRLCKESVFYRLTAS